MANITITIPDEQMSRAIDGLCKAGGWRSIELDGPKGAFAKKMVMDYVRETVKAVERSSAVEVAIAAVPQATAIDVT